MTPLERYPALRQFLYTAQWVVNLVLAVMAFVFASLGMSPMWFVITGGAFNIVWSYTGTVASRNVGSSEPSAWSMNAAVKNATKPVKARAKDERGATVPGFVWILAAVALVLIVLGLVGINVNVRA